MDQEAHFRNKSLKQNTNIKKKRWLLIIIFHDKIQFKE